MSNKKHQRDVKLLEHASHWASLPDSFLNQLLGQLQEGAVILDMEGRIILVNPAAEKLLGQREADLHGKHIHNFMNGLPAFNILENIINEGALTDKVILTKSDGNWSFIEYHISLVNQQPGIKGVILTLRDFSLSKQHAALIHLFESDILGTAFGDIYGHISDANDAFLEMLGYTREEFLNSPLNWREITPEDYLAQDEKAIRSLQKSKLLLPYEKQLIRKDGQRIDILTGVVLEGGSETECGAFVLDITLKKQAERALVEGEKIFKAMTNETTLLAGVINPDKQLIYLSENTMDFLGTTREEFTKTGWGPYFHPDDLPIVTNRLEEAYRERHSYQYECRLRRKDGVYRWILYSGGPIMVDGEFMGFVGCGWDIHDRKEAEASLADYTKRLERSNKELEQFATIASHDLQEPLRKVMVFSGHLLSVAQNKLDEEGLDDIHRIQRSTQRMHRLINDLLDLSRVIRRGQAYKLTDFSTVLREVLADLSYKIKDTQAQVTVEEMPIIEVDSQQIHQMFYQLIDNSLTFHRPGITPVVKVSGKPRSSELYEIVVEDNGQGFKPEYAEKIFNTFVRLHHERDYPGTGIGLSLVQKIVERHGGTITAKGEPGKGATFTILLPSRQTQSASRSESDNI